MICFLAHTVHGTSLTYVDRHQTVPGSSRDRHVVTLVTWAWRIVVSMNVCGCVMPCSMCEDMHMVGDAVEWGVKWGVVVYRGG